MALFAWTVVGVVAGFLAGKIVAARGRAPGRSNIRELGRYLAAVTLALALVSVVGRTATPQEGTGEQEDDIVIASKVRAAMLDEPALERAEINVGAYRGVVQLSGFVNSQAAADKAVEVTEGVGGVKSVRNDMLIK